MFKFITLKSLSLALLCFGSAFPASAQEGSSSLVPSQEITPDKNASPSAIALSPLDGVVGHFGFGYFTENAPIGVRYWLDRKLGVDLGLDAAFSSGNAQAYRFGLDAGVVYALAHYHYSVVFARAGLGYFYEGISGPQPGLGNHQLNATAFLGAELFLGALGFPNISLQGGYGLTAAYNGGGGSAFIMGTSSAGLNVVSTGTLGFHIYL